VLTWRRASLAGSLPIIGWIELLCLPAVCVNGTLELTHFAPRQQLGN
jgi:hypothetical protein